MSRSVKNVLSLAAQISANPNVGKRTFRGNIGKWRRQAPRRAGRGYNQRNGRAYRQSRGHTCSEGFHFHFGFSEGFWRLSEGFAGGVVLGLGVSFPGRTLDFLAHRSPICPASVRRSSQKHKFYLKKSHAKSWLLRFSDKMGLRILQYAAPKWQNGARPPCVFSAKRRGAVPPQI